MKTALVFGGFFFLGIILAGSFLLARNHPVRTVALFSSPTPAPRLSVENAPRDSVRGMVATMSGEVQWESRTATVAADLTAPVVIQQGESLATGNGKVQISFADFGLIELAPESAVSVVQTLPINFVFTESSGSAKFVSSGRSPFTVRAYHLLVNIASGSATILVNPDTHTVAVLPSDKPLVLAYNDANYVSHELTIAAGERYSFDDDRRRGVISGK